MGTSGSGVTDVAWANAAKHYDDDQLAALVSLIALINTYNRLTDAPGRAA
jgi:alkylhydroperoxidase family enzyme